MKNQDLNPEELKKIEDYLANRDKRNLLIHNDDINTFAHVIIQLVRFCDQDEIQAEQCAYLIHYKGKCCVKSGSLEQLNQIKEKLEMNNLTVTIEK